MNQADPLALESRAKLPFTCGWLRQGSLPLKLEIDSFSCLTSIVPALLNGRSHINALWGYFSAKKMLLMLTVFVSRPVTLVYTHN